LLMFSPQGSWSASACSMTGRSRLPHVLPAAKLSSVGGGTSSCPTVRGGTPCTNRLQAAVLDVLDFLPCCLQPSCPTVGVWTPNRAHSLSMMNKSLSARTDVASFKGQYRLLFPGQRQHTSQASSLSIVIARHEQLSIEGLDPTRSVFDTIATDLSRSSCQQHQDDAHPRF